MKTVLLYQPKTEKGIIKPRSPPLALLSISGLLLKEQYDVKIFDAIIDKDAQAKLLECLNNDVVCLGISVWVGYPIKDSLELCEKVKKISPNLPIVWGGWHPSLFPSQTLESPYVDIVVKGQGEVTFLELVKSLETNDDLKSVKGISYKKNSKIITNPDRARTRLDDLPMMPYHLVDIERYITQDLNSRTVGYISSQGCPYNCGFCSDAKLYGGLRIDLSVDNLVRDIKSLIENYNINGIFFEDTNFLTNKKKVLGFCKAIIDNKWDLKWAADARSNELVTYDDDSLALIKSSGCELLIIGAESGSQRILDFLNKRITVGQTLKTADLCNKFGIPVRFQFIVGLPDETADDFKKTKKLIRYVYLLNKKNAITLYFYTPYPGTFLYDKVIKEHGFKPPNDLIEWADYDPITIPMKWVTKTYRNRLRLFLFLLRLRKKLKL